MTDGGGAGARHIASLADIPEREGRSVTIDGEAIAVFRCAGGVRAVADACPHLGGPLSDGIVAGDTVACPMHGRVASLLTGEVTDCEQTVRVFDVVVEEGEIYLAMPVR